MDTTERDNTFIRRYIHFELTDVELADFEKRILTDIEFAKKVQIYQDLENVARHSSASIEDQEQWEMWRAILDKKQYSTTKNISWRWVAVIAAGFTLIFGLWQINHRSQQSDWTALIAASWNENVGLDYKIMRGKDKDSLQQLIHNAFMKYEKEDYQSVLNILRDFNPDVPNYEDALLLRGLSLYKKGKTERALQTLEILSAFPTRKKAKAARWYLGLIYFEQRDLPAAEKNIEIPKRKNQPIKLKKY